MTPTTQPAPIAIHVMAPTNREMPLYVQGKPSQFQQLNDASQEATLAALIECKSLAHAFIDKHHPGLDNFSRGMRWAISAQLLQAMVTGEQEPCITEFDGANNHLLGKDVTFIQLAVDEEVSRAIDYDDRPTNEKELSDVTTKLLALFHPSENAA